MLRGKLAIDLYWEVLSGALVLVGRKPIILKIPSQVVHRVAENAPIYIHIIFGCREFFSWYNLWVFRALSVNLRLRLNRLLIALNAAGISDKILVTDDVCESSSTW